MGSQVRDSQKLLVEGKKGVGKESFPESVMTVRILNLDLWQYIKTFTLFLPFLQEHINNYHLNKASGSPEPNKMSFFLHQTKAIFTNIKLQSLVNVYVSCSGDLKYGHVFPWSWPVKSVFFIHNLSSFSCSGFLPLFTSFLLLLIFHRLLCTIYYFRRSCHIICYFSL